MGVFDTKENIKKVFTVRDFYTLDVVNLGMSGSLEEEAKKMFKVSLDDMIRELKNTPLKKFERLFFEFKTKRFKNPNGYYVYIDLENIRTLMLKWFLRKWVKKKYRSEYNSPHCESHIRHLGDDRPTRYIHIYNGEVIEWATGANMMFVFRPK